jgi:hypothetical protein
LVVATLKVPSSTLRGAQILLALRNGLAHVVPVMLQLPYIVIVMQSYRRKLEISQPIIYGRELDRMIMVDRNGHLFGPFSLGLSLQDTFLASLAASIRAAIAHRRAPSVTAVQAWAGCGGAAGGWCQGNRRLSIKRRLVNPLYVTADQLEVVENVLKADSRRLEGTYAFLGNDSPKSRYDGWFLYEIHVASKALCQVLAKSFQPPEMVEFAGRKAGARMKRQINVGRIGGLVSGKRPEHGDRLDAAGPKVSLMASQNCDQLGSRWSPVSPAWDSYH